MFVGVLVTAAVAHRYLPEHARGGLAALNLDLVPPPPSKASEAHVIDVVRAQWNCNRDLKNSLAPFFWAFPSFFRGDLLVPAHHTPYVIGSISIITTRHRKPFH